MEVRSSSMLLGENSIVEVDLGSDIAGNGKRSLTDSTMHGPWAAFESMTKIISTTVLVGWCTA